MQNIINHDLQEQAHSLVATKLSFLNPTTFDSDDDRVDFTGKDNVQWNLHHFIRSGKLCSNGFYACKSTLGYIYSISNNIVQAITSDSKESYVRLEKRLVLQQDRLENNIAELNIALAEYEMIFEDCFARQALDDYMCIEDKKVTQFGKFAKDSAKKGEASATYYTNMSLATQQIAIADVAMRWFADTLDAKINPDGNDKVTKGKPSILGKIAKSSIKA